MAEFEYGLIITGLCVPPFVHYALRYIRSNIPEARQSLAGFKIAAGKDFAETKRLLRRK